MVLQSDGLFVMRKEVVLGKISTFLYRIFVGIVSSIVIVNAQIQRHFQFSLVSCVLISCVLRSISLHA